MAEINAKYGVVLIACFAVVSAGADLQDFNQKLRDMAKNVNETATTSFSTEFTAPDLRRRLLNGTVERIVSSGVVRPTYVDGRYMVTSVRRQNGGYNVTIKINKVTKDDAGTYIASSNDDLQDSVKNYAEFIVIEADGKPACGKFTDANGNPYLSWQFTRYGHVNATVAFLNASGYTIFQFPIPSGSGSVVPETWTVPAHDAVTHCVTTFLPSSRCAHCNNSGWWISNVTQDVNVTTRSSTSVMSSLYTSSYEITIVHQSTSDGNLSAGAIAGIVFAAIIVVFLVVVVAYVLYKKVCMRRQTENEEHGTSVPLNAAL